MCTLHTAMFSALLLNMMPSKGKKDQLEIEHKVCTTSCQTTPGVAMTTSLILIVQVCPISLQLVVCTAGHVSRLNKRFLLLVVTMACVNCSELSVNHLYKLAG